MALKNSSLVVIDGGIYSILKLDWPVVVCFFFGGGGGVFNVQGIFLIGYSCFFLDVFFFIFILIKTDWDFTGFELSFFTTIYGEYVWNMFFSNHCVLSQISKFGWSPCRVLAVKWWATVNLKKKKVVGFAGCNLKSEAYFFLMLMPYYCHECCCCCCCCCCFYLCCYHALIIQFYYYIQFFSLCNFHVWMCCQLQTSLISRTFPSWRQRQNCLKMILKSFEPQKKNITAFHYKVG